MKNHRLCAVVGVGLGVGVVIQRAGGSQAELKRGGGRPGAGSGARLRVPLTVVWENGGKQVRYGGSPGT